MFKFKTNTLLLLLLLLNLPKLQSAEYFVSTTGEDDFTTIQAAINFALDGDTVTVRPGTYYERLRIENKNIILQSTEPQNTSVVASTIIDAERKGSVIILDEDQTAECIVSGFTLRNGKPSSWYSNSGVIFGIRFSNIYKSGAAILGNNSMATIKNNIIKNSYLPASIESRFKEDLSYCSGFFRCHGIIENNIFENSTYEQPLPDLQYSYLYKGVLTECNGIIRNNIIRNNDENGIQGCSAEIFGNKIYANQKSGIDNCYRYIYNNLIYDNLEWGIRDSRYIRNCVIYNNSFGLFRNTSLENSIVWNNGTNADNPDQVSFTNANYNCIQDGTTTGTNINSDPGFVDAEARNFRLTIGSKCIDTGTYLQNIETDIEGQIRPINGDLSYGWQEGSFDYDIGAYEFDPSPNLLPPQFFRATRLTETNEIKFDWFGNHSGVQYHIYRAPENDLTQAQYLGSTLSTNYIDQNSTHGLQYYWCVVDNGLERKQSKSLQSHFNYPAQLSTSIIDVGTGEPVEGAIAQLIKPDGVITDHIAVSDSQGRFVFNEIFFEDYKEQFYIEIFVNQPDYSKIITAPLKSFINLTQSESTSLDTIYISQFILVPHEYETISEAIDSADAGDEIVIMPGTYGHKFHLDKDIHIRSLNPKDWECVQNTVIMGVRLSLDSSVKEECRVSGLRFSQGSESKLQFGPHGSSYVQYLPSGIYGNNSTATIENCIIDNCRRQAVYEFNGTITNSIIQFWDGGISDSNCTITNSLIYSIGHNSIQTCFDNPILKNCTTYNLLFWGTEFTIEDSIIWKNKNITNPLFLSNPTNISNSLVCSDGLSTEALNNILDESPGFISLKDFDFRLQRSSPAIDVLNGSSMPNDILGNTRGVTFDSESEEYHDMGAFEYYPNVSTVRDFLLGSLPLSESTSISTDTIEFRDILSQDLPAFQYFTYY